ncbi:hypothetical protein GA845_18605 [Burkholderia pseudomallei]|nr:hypothetical protein [Burkholderia pseudomallei]NRE35297.1 hypothetical protein [Burkholderia pseudomallei]
MKRQIGCSGAESAGKKRVTKRQRFPSPPHTRVHMTEQDRDTSPSRVLGVRQRPSSFNVIGQTKQIIPTSCSRIKGRNAV